jgi:predicted sugar kinase
MASALDCELARGEVLAVTSRARIHCALLNTSGLFGRVDGGIGFSVEEPHWEIEVGWGGSPEESGLPEELRTAVLSSDALQTS